MPECVEAGLLVVEEGVVDEGVVEEDFDTSDGGIIVGISILDDEIEVLEVERTTLEEFAEGVGEADIDLFDDKTLEVDSTMVDEFDEGVGVGETVNDNLDDISAGISLLPSSSSSESGARVQAGASEDDGCSLSPSSSSSESGARVQLGASEDVGCSLSPSSSSK
jgi:hypothetical protein